MAEARRAEEGVGFLWRTRRAPSPPARGLRERCKLPQWGPGQSPGRNRFWCISKLVEGIKTAFTTKRDTVGSTPRANLVTNSRSVFVSNFSLKFWGCSNTQNTPLVTALVWAMTIARRGLKTDVIRHKSRLGSEAAFALIRRIVTRSV